MSFFTEKKLFEAKEKTQRYFKSWKIFGIAFSGDIHDQYNHLLDTFVIDNSNNELSNINESSILDEQNYIALFENIDLEKITIDISKSSRSEPIIY